MHDGLTGGEAIVEMLRQHDIEYAFGMGGFQSLPYYDALARTSSPRHVVIRDEKHGAFAADGYARVRNRPALADATLGPGATNLISGAAESFGASIPMILLTSEVNSQIAGRSATQESDQFSMLRPTCKMSINLNRIERIPELMRRAVSVATSGRPGPVNVNVPEEVFHGRHTFLEGEFYADPAASIVGGRRTAPDSNDVEKAARLLAAAERPVAIVGGGIHLSGAYAALQELAELLGIPVATTISGKGALSEDHPLSAGICGRYSRMANDLIARADTLLVVGCKLGEIATNRWSLIRPDAQIVHMDVDPTELGKVHRVNVGIWSDARLGLLGLAAALRGRRLRSSDQTNLLESLRRDWQASAAPRYESDAEPINMARLLSDLRRVVPAESIIVADGGFAAHWSALLFDVLGPGRRYIANRGHAAIGYGLPGAIGAKLAAPDMPIIALCGDNGFAMAAAELETAKRSGANIIIVVVNNGALGYVKALQHSMYSDRFNSVDFLETNYAEVAHAFGCEGVQVKAPDDLVGAFRTALEAQANTPFLVDVLTTTNPAEMLPGIDSRTAVAPE
jgi:acetolactate synthase-1/2/3 large subunit